MALILALLCLAPNLIPVAVGQSLDLEPQRAESSAVIRRFNYFDLELLQEFSESNENVFISPASIKTTLSMILEGARGKCAQEIGNALRIEDIDAAEIRKQLESLLFDLNVKTPNQELKTANAVFFSDKLNVLTDYQMKLTQHYKAYIRPIDFTKPAEAVDRINEWVNNATMGSIPSIIGDNLFEESTLVIANALYFKGKWEKEFNPKETLIKCFETHNLGCKNVPMMQKTDIFNYNLISHLNAHAIELPYQGNKFSMLLLVPSAGTNIRVLARDMQHAHFDSILDTLKPTEVMLEIPKFEIESEVNLIEYLRTLKIQEIFGPNANLTGIVQKSNIRVGNIVHKAKIEVNEEGTKAAAATSAVVVPLMGETALSLSADKPFIFFIYQKESRNIIFEGILLDPKTSENTPPSAAEKVIPAIMNRNIQLNKFSKVPNRKFR